MATGSGPDGSTKISVLVEVEHGVGMSPMAAGLTTRSISLEGFAVDEEFAPVSMSGPVVPGGFGMAAMPSPTSYVIRGEVEDQADFDRLAAQPGVAGVWVDTEIAPFAGPRGKSGADGPPDKEDRQDLSLAPMGPEDCPIPPCDCLPNTPKGTIADVADYLGVDDVWRAGFRGTGIVVGVVDGGITAQGRPVIAGETSRRIPRVIGGWPVSSWGTQASSWGEHGNMCSTDVLGMAPEAQIYDLRISGPGSVPSLISRALQAYDWAIARHRTDGTPQVLSNSWGIFQESWDPAYARDPNHPFTRKVVEALDEGISVLFAAGNCGKTCPDGRCGPDAGPGRSIWGANGHPRVMTVGAVNKEEEFVGYSSQGPAALSPDKPDFVSVTHFTGYHHSDSGTSAATPILAGAVALLREAFPDKSHDDIKEALAATAKDIGPAGWDKHTGAGIVRIKGAYDRLGRLIIHPTVTLACTRLCPSVRIACESRLCPSRPVLCSSVACPSETLICGSAVCPSSPIVCRSDVCPTRTIACESVACPTQAGCPTLSCPTLFCPTLGRCPSLGGCPSLACRPGGPIGRGDWRGSLGGGWSGAEGEWPGDDPASEWYGG